VALVILAFRLLDLGVKHLAWRLVGDQTRPRRACVGLVNFDVVFGLAAPFCIALVQFHPQKIDCRTTPASLGLSYSGVRLESEGLGWRWGEEKMPPPVPLRNVGCGNKNALPPVSEGRHAHPASDGKAR
jgi:hypothetical protein